MHQAKATYHTLNGLREKLFSIPTKEVTNLPFRLLQEKRVEEKETHAEVADETASSVIRRHSRDATASSHALPEASLRALFRALFASNSLPMPNRKSGDQKLPQNQIILMRHAGLGLGLSRPLRVSGSVTHTSSPSAVHLHTLHTRR